MPDEKLEPVQGHPLADSVLSLLRRISGEALGPKMMLAEIDRLRSDVDRLSALNLAFEAAMHGEHKLVRAVLEDAREVFTVEGGGIALFAAACREMLAIAPNYVQLTCSDDMGPLFITVQRGDGKTPATLHQEEIAKARELQEMVTNLCDALTEQGETAHRRRCVACDHEWHIDESAGAKVHGEGCVVAAAGRMLKDLGA